LAVESRLIPSSSHYPSDRTDKACVWDIIEQVPADIVDKTEKYWLETADKLLILSRSQMLLDLSIAHFAVPRNTGWKIIAFA